MFEPTGINDQGEDSNLPDFIDFNSETKSFLVDTFDVSNFGEYRFGLRISYKEYPSYSKRCETKVSVKY